MGSGEHLGDPCICCGVPHDEVAVGDCPRAHKCNQTKDALRAEIIAWIKAGNAGIKLINEQRAIIAAQGARIEQLLDIIQAAHDTFTQGGTNPIDDDVISVLMAKILEEALS